ncbi:transmembrane protein, partial [Cystoisospora suis]
PQAVEHGVKRDEPNEEVSPDRHVKSPALGAPSEADAERRESPEEVGHEEEPDEASEGETLPGGDVKSPALGAPSEADTERTESPEEVREEETQDEASEGEASPDTDGGISPLGAPSEADTERSESPEEAGHERRHEDRGDGVARNRDVDEAAEKPSPEMEAGKPEYPSVAVAFSSSPSADTRAPRETGTALVPPRKTDGPARKQTAEGLPPHSAGHKEDSAAVVASPLQGLFFNVDRAASAGSSDTPLNREGIIFNPTVIDQLIAAIAAQVENRDGSAPLFLPSICPACKVEIVTYAPIHLPDIGEGREFERARQQLNYLQARHTPQDFPEESRDNAEPSRPRAPVDGMSRTAGVASFIRVESAQSPSTPATAQSQSSTLESSSVLEPPEARDLPQDLQQTVTAVQTRAGDSRESTSSENRRKRPKELRGLSTDTRNTQAVVLQEGGLSRVSSSLKASRPTKHEIAPSADDPKPPGVHRSRLEAGEEEGVFVVMFACFPEGKGDTSLMVANLEVRVSSEMPTPVTA